MLAWMGNALILTSIWRLGDRHRDAWLWAIAGNILWTVFGVQQGLWSVVFIDGVMTIITIRNWRLWK